MAIFMDLTGRKFGRLLVISRAENRKKKVMWNCECDCDNKTRKVVEGASLTSGNTKSCGCITKEKMKTHGKTNTRLFKTWDSMKQRCLNKNDKAFFNYGGRGIKIFEEWLGDNGFENFYNWSMANDYTDELTIDRIEVNGNYEPNNCRWATMKVQQNNRRNNFNIEVEGLIKTVTEWSDESGITKYIIVSRFQNGLRGKDLFEKVVPRKLDKQSGEKGIVWSKKANKWQLALNKKYIGLYDTVEEAVKIRDAYNT